MYKHNVKHETIRETYNSLLILDTIGKLGESIFKRWSTEMAKENGTNIDLNKKLNPDTSFFSEIYDFIDEKTIKSWCKKAE